MNYFHYVNDEFWCEDVSITKIASEVGTPFYLYSHKTLSHHFNVFTQAFTDIPHIICYAVKANSNIAVLRTFSQLGGGADIVSGGELYRALKAGVDPRKIVYSGVGKTEEEIKYALASNILMFNIESAQELTDINACASKIGKRAGVALRVNPDVNAETHPHISTGLKENKFGIPLDSALSQYRTAKKFSNVDLIGISCHIGSQVTKIAPFLEAFNHVRTLISLLREEGIFIKYIDLGGGLGIKYNKEEPPHPSEYAKALIDARDKDDFIFIFEPGRVIVGNAGVLVSKVLYTKSNLQKNFIVIDAGMNDLVRPSFYNSYHHIQRVLKKNGEEFIADVVGPICESGDYLAKDRRLSLFEQGDLMAVMGAGAYGFTMSSNYNSRPRIPEGLVHNDRYFVIRKREDYADLVKGETVPDFLI
ncbi:MAG: diaminopimelate decarboxylase [Syntrophales bacterium LBB04]|nr:diaminopimelate decarboxylase [Syntrophales bacterium LBB04]